MSDRLADSRLGILGEGLVEGDNVVLLVCSVEAALMLMNVAAALGVGAVGAVVLLGFLSPFLRSLFDFMLMVAVGLVARGGDGGLNDVLDQGFSAQGFPHNAIAGDRFENLVGLVGSGPALLDQGKVVLLPLLSFVRLSAAVVGFSPLLSIGDRLLQLFKVVAVGG